MNFLNLHKILAVFILLVGVSAYADPKPLLKVTILGDSLTEGYGVAKEDAFPNLLQESLGTQARVIAAGISGSTTASAPSRMRWILKSRPEIIVLALGGNDALRALPPSATETNLSKAIEMAQKAGSTVILAGMKAPPNYGKKYSTEFETVYTRLKTKYKLPFLPFILEGVAGEAKLNIDDGIHPNPEGHKIVAKNLLPLIQIQISQIQTSQTQTKKAKKP